MSENDRQKKYENLVHAYSSWLHRYAYSLAGDSATAEDLVQETYLRAWRFMDALKEEKAAKSWLTTIYGEKMHGDLNENSRNIPM